MFKNLNKEIVVKKTVLETGVASIIAGIIWTILLYFCLTEFNEEIVEFMKLIDENNLALQATLILSPVIIMITLFSNYTPGIAANDISSREKSSKKSKKIK